MIWKTIEEFPRYEISNAGLVRSSNTLKIKKPYSCNGYTKIQLINKSDKRSFRVHRLVASAFIGKIGDGMHVDHKNRIRSDNRVENLRIVHPRENILNRRLAVDIVDDIIEWYKNGETIDTIKERLKG